MARLGTVDVIRNFVFSYTLAHIVLFARYCPETSGAGIEVGRHGLIQTDCGSFLVSIRKIMVFAMPSYTFKGCVVIVL